MKKLLFIAILLCLFCNYLYSNTIIIKTKAPQNQDAIFRFRVPKNYDPNRKDSYRVLVYFGGRNTTGKSEVAGNLGWGAWCDQYDVFLLVPSLRNDNYWQPEEWSGKALKKALLKLKKDYNVCTTKLLYYGYSAGSQASNLFPAWEPSMCRAWVSHACGVFHEPKASMKDIPGLVTCGDADSARYIISRNFVEKSRRKGINIIWKSFPNHPHDVPPDSLKLARAFLTYYHELYKEDLSYSFGSNNHPKLISYVGDDSEAVYYAADSAKAKNVLKEDKVILPCKAIAEAWGKYEE